MEIHFYITVTLSMGIHLPMRRNIVCKRVAGKIASRESVAYIKFFINECFDLPTLCFIFLFGMSWYFSVGP